MLLWLSLLTVPTCAVTSALVVGVTNRHKELEDGALLRQFIVVLVIGFALLYTTSQRPSVQQRLHPELQLQAGIEADPIYQALAYIGPEYAARFLAVLDTEKVTSATLPQARLQARSMITALVTNRMGFADQSTRIAWGQVMLDTLRELQARSPEQCYAALSGQPLDRETLANGFSAQNTAAFEAAALQVLLESPGIESPGKGLHRRLPDVETAADFNASMREYDSIRQKMVPVFGPAADEFFTKKPVPQTALMSADTACAARIYQLDAVLKQPKATAALLIDSALR
jgi:hypothetical protein